MGEASDEVRQKLMMQVAEILFGEEKMVSTKRLGRIMIYMTLLFDQVKGPKQA